MTNTTSKFNQVCIMQGTIFAENENEFIDFFKNQFGVRIKLIGQFDTTMHYENGEVQKDLAFYVHDEDIKKFAISRFEMGVRWLEDVMSNNPYLYPNHREIKKLICW